MRFRPTYNNYKMQTTPGLSHLFTCPKCQTDLNLADRKPQICTQCYVSRCTHCLNKDKDKLQPCQYDRNDHSRYFYETCRFQEDYKTYAQLASMKSGTKCMCYGCHKGQIQGFCSTHKVFACNACLKLYCSDHTQSVTQIGWDAIKAFATGVVQDPSTKFQFISAGAKRACEQLLDENNTLFSGDLNALIKEVKLIKILEAVNIQNLEQFEADFHRTILQQSQTTQGGAGIVSPQDSPGSTPDILGGLRRV
ncbi:hypothetical protein FGO68_gene12652 [Halteria grandinella]|uniref:Uncharacterized protein n=1 Tax=Halteria grandinella TaxID=5974 RepID=A0A8J8NKK9_HALGN|nr:hypothetical protein FGO68_gene12652 [Halteria grandinella]